MFFNSNEIGLILQLFELRKTLLENKMVKFYAQGVCMLPCIWPQDTLHIEQKDIDEIKIGDIAVYRRLNRLFAHRVIEKGEDKDFNYIITRPDLAKYGNDGPIFGNDILGVVSRIERKGAALGTEKKYCSLFIRLFLHICLKWYYFGKHLFGKIIYVISYIQQFKTYQKISKVLFSRLSDKKISFSIHIPLNSKTAGRFYRVISSEELVRSNIERNKDFVSEWALTMNVDSKPAGFLAFIFKPRDYPVSGWWLSEMKIRVRYRRTAVEERLFQKLDELLSCAGIPELFTGVPEDAHLARMVFKNLGFKEIENKSAQSAAQVIMLRKAKGDD